MQISFFKQIKFLKKNDENLSFKNMNKNLF